MPTFSFRSITAGETIALQATDTLTLDDIPANSVVVHYNPTTVTVIAGGREIEFPFPISALSLAGRLTSAGGGRLIIGASGDDVFDTGVNDTKNDGLYGGAGDDSLNGRGGNNVLQGNQGNDTLQGFGGYNMIYGGQDNDRIYVQGFGQGNKGEDWLQGSSGMDTLLGGQGSDTIDGNGGADYLNGNLGDDNVTGAGSLFGDDGDDGLRATGDATLFGGAGDDLLIADAGITSRGQGLVTMFGGDGDDDLRNFHGGTWLDAGAGNDWISSLAENAQTIYGSAGDDDIWVHIHYSSLIDAGDGDDQIDFYGTNSTVYGGTGADTIACTYSGNTNYIFGGDGDDVITRGFDTLMSGGSESVNGGAGNDRLDGFWMVGGDGADQFAMGEIHFSTLISHRIQDWSGPDRIVLPSHVDRAHFTYTEATAADEAAAVALFTQSALSHEVMAVQVGTEVIVFVAGTASDKVFIDAVVLVGRTLADIDVGSFV